MNKLSFSETVRGLDSGPNDSPDGRFPLPALPSPSPYLAVTMPMYLAKYGSGITRANYTGHVCITHIPTGRKVCAVRSRRVARIVLRVLAALPVDWSREDGWVGSEIRDLPEWRAWLHAVNAG